MALMIPDEVWDEFEKRWSELGLSPILIFRLCERGFLHCEIDFAMRRIVGDNWLSLKAGEWIDRMAERGTPSVLYSLEHDTPPLIDILVEEISLVLENDYPEKLCEECSEIFRKNANSVRCDA
jgi:hypothetical protein